MKLIILTSFILLLAIYLIFRLATSKPIEMALDKGGRKKGDILEPNFERPDIQSFFLECRESGISIELAKKFLIAIYNTLHFEKEPQSPRLHDDRYEVWALDDDIEDPINYMLENYHLKKIRWNHKDILKLGTIKDILVYLSNRIGPDVS